jgi:cell division protein FtsA
MLKKTKQVTDSLLKKRKKAVQRDKFIVGLDIGTEFVKAVIARVDNDDMEIVGVGRAHQQLSDMQAGAIADIAAVVANCDSALSEAEQKAGVSVRSAVIGIAGELVKGRTITVRCRRSNPTKTLDIEEIEQILSLVQQRAAKKAKEQLSWELGGKEVEIRLVNSALVSLHIDGYPVTNPVGFQGKEVVVQLYTAFAPLVHIGALEKAADELDLDLLAVAAEPFAVARAVIGNDPNQNMDAILMDVGGGTTDIAVVHDAGVYGTKMFGIGGRAFTRSIERELSIDFIDAEQHKLALETTELPRQDRIRIENALAKTLDVWISGVELALGEFTETDHLPNKILLCGGGSSLHMLKQRLEQSQWHGELPFTRKPVISHIKPEQVVGIADTTGDIYDHTFITAMGLLRVGLDTLQQQLGQDSGTIRQKIDRMLRV